jgi:hypothetical protein
MWSTKPTEKWQTSGSTKLRPACPQLKNTTNQNKNLTATRKRGSTLFLTLAVTMLVILVFTLGFTFYSFFTAQRQLEEKLQLVAMLAAQQINANDRFGQINNMTAAARQLLFNSRSECNAAASIHPEILPLANALAEEAAAGGELVLEERTASLKGIVADVRSSVGKAKAGSFAKDYSVELPWLHRGDVTLDACVLGSSSSMDSNVAAPLGDELLASEDKKYIDSKAKLYTGNVKLPLPEPDKKLDFRVSSLDAPVQGTIAPLRLIANNDFRQLFNLDVGSDKPVSINPGDYIPADLQLRAHQRVQIKFPIQAEEAIGATVTAVTNGASPMP